MLEATVRNGKPIHLASKPSGKTERTNDHREPGLEEGTPAGAMLAPMIVRDQQIGVIGAFY